MHTEQMIAAIVVAILPAAVLTLIGLMLWLGWMLGLALSLSGLAVVLSLYLWVIKPWHLRWGATDAEVAQAMPGDDLIPHAGSATHAITIAAPAEEIWPWLVQIGFGRRRQPAW